MAAAMAAPSQGEVVPVVPWRKRGDVSAGKTWEKLVYFSYKWLNKLWFMVDITN